LSGVKDPGLVYDPRVFQSLGMLFQAVDRWYSGAVPVDEAEWPVSLCAFLAEHQWVDRLAEMRANTASLPAFRKRFFQGFNAFNVLKYIHFATEHSWPKVPVEQAAATLLTWMGMAGAVTESEPLLTRYRQLDREGYWFVRP
ncbi:MAG: hypothetical protein H7838_06555, partial [Magnetococcus sp. DMHC-8]